MQIDLITVGGLVIVGYVVFKYLWPVVLEKVKEFTDYMKK